MEDRASSQKADYVTTKGLSLMQQEPLTRANSHSLASLSLPLPINIPEIGLWNTTCPWRCHRRHPLSTGRKEERLHLITWRGSLAQQATECFVWSQCANSMWKGAPQAASHIRMCTLPKIKIIYIQEKKKRKQTTLFELN